MTSVVLRFEADIYPSFRQQCAQAFRPLDNNQGFGFMNHVGKPDGRYIF